MEALRLVVGQLPLINGFDKAKNESLAQCATFSAHDHRGEKRINHYISKCHHQQQQQQEQTITEFLQQKSWHCHLTENLK